MPAVRCGGNEQKGESHGKWSSDTPVLDLIANMTASSIEASSLDADKLMLVRIAALVAVDPCRTRSTSARQPTSTSIPRRSRACGRDAPIVGTPRDRRGRDMVRALGLALELAELEEE